VKRTTCGACQSADLHPFLDLGDSPIADAYTATADEVSKMYPLEVAVCMRCKLVQLLEVVDSETLFGTGYSFYSSASPPLSEYHRVYAESIIGAHRDEAKRFVLEVGCNDGDMLRWFRSPARLTLGVDPASGPATVTESRGLDVWNSEFTTQVAWDIRQSYGTAGVVIANHVLAHVADVAEMLHGISVVLDDGGVAFVEVQYLPDLLVNNAFDLVYHEHRNFFSLTSLEAAVNAAGLIVNDVQLTERQHGSIRVTLRKRLPHPLPAARIQRLRTSESWLNTGLQAYQGVQGRVERIRTRLWNLLRENEPVAGYGAPAKATTLLNYCGLDVGEIAYVVDSTPAKQGRFIPGTGIPIVSPDMADARVFLLLAWNYASTIINGHRRSYMQGADDDDVRWIVPIPAPVLL
jgi:hypothetical protein